MDKSASAKRDEMEGNRTADPAITTVDQLLRQRAVDPDQTPLLAFPKSRTGVTDYEPLPGASLHRLIDGAVKVLMEKGFAPVTEDESVIGICAPTDLDYVVTVFALVRLRYVPVLLSPRLAPSGIRALLDGLGARVLFYSAHHASFPVRDADLGGELQKQPLPERSEYDHARHAETPEFHHPGGDDLPAARRCLITHSSGSTGLPKTINVNDAGFLHSVLGAQSGTSFTTLPLYHSFGLHTYLKAIRGRRTLFLMSGYVPQTPDLLTAAVSAARPDTLFTVPYIIKLMAEKPDGIAVLRSCQSVISGGSRLPDEVGDFLVREGVQIGLSFGSTEAGHILDSFSRPRDDKAWDYLRVKPQVAPFLIMRPLDATVEADTRNEKRIHECIILDGLPAKSASNSDDPPNSWHTRDLFVPHPTILGAWKFVGRLDDRVTLLNGEKVLPLVFEGQVRQHPLVREAVVFGVGREVPGLLVFRASGTHVDDEACLDQIWPFIEAANARTEAFAQIGREMVVILEEGVECPLTDKSSIKRAQVYGDFAHIIESTYAMLESKDKIESLLLTVPEMEEWIMRTARSLGIQLDDARSDFFSAGVDSLKAIHIRSRILKHIDLGGHESECTSMIAYDCGNAEKLARRLHTIRIGSESSAGQDGVDDLGVMTRLIQTYSDFSMCQRLGSATRDLNKDAGIVVILTGVTGFLGAHVLSSLLALESVSKVYCFIRSDQAHEQPVAARFAQSLQEKELNCSLDKVVPLQTDLSQNGFGLGAGVLDALRSDVTHIIHCAWTVNFAIPLSAFESQLHGLHQLLEFSLQTAKQACVLFCSSVGVVAQTATDAPVVIPSAPIPPSDSSPSMGYGRSKIVGERIVEAAASSGANATILRIGQIVPGQSRGTKLWNPSEAVPLMIRSALKDSVGALPILGPGHDACTWLPADTLADAILDLAHITNVQGDDDGKVVSTQLVYNLVNPHSFSWEEDMLPALREAGLRFDTVSWEDWLRRLEASTEDAASNPSRKLLHHWRSLEQAGQSVSFDTAAAVADSLAMRNMKRVVDVDGFMDKVVEAWKALWENGGRT